MFEIEPQKTGDASLVVPIEIEEEELRIGQYRQALIPHLDPKILRRNPWRLVLASVYLAFAVLGVFLIVQADVAWPFKFLCGIMIGICTGNLAFFGHELLHGSIVKNQNVQDFLFLIGVAPFFISPTYWRYSHNRLHHGHSQKLIHDPDAFPNLRIFKSSKFMRFMFPYTPGSGHKRSLMYFFFWFSFHNLVGQTYLRFRNKGFDTMNHTRATLELGFQFLLAGAFLYYIGPSNWLWAFVIPILVQNYWLMSYIATNHNLSPLTNVNDPLVNSLSVSNHPILEFIGLNFGYHVEHHLFPEVSGKHAKVIHRLLIEKYPSKYKIMPKAHAMRALYRTPRIYKNSRELVHPVTGDVHSTI